MVLKGQKWKTVFQNMQSWLSQQCIHPVWTENVLPSDLEVTFKFHLTHFLFAGGVAGWHPVLTRWAGGRYSLTVTARDKQGFNFTSVCEVPSSTACCLSELFLTRLKMPLVYNCLISNKCAELRWLQGKRLAKCGVLVLGAFCFRRRVSSCLFF